MRNIDFCSFFIGSFGHAQVKTSTFQVAASVPIIPSVESSDYMNSIPINPATGYYYAVFKFGVEESFSHRRGVEAGGQLDYVLSEKFYLTSGLTLNYIQFQKNTRITSTIGTFQILTENPFPTTGVGQPFGVIFASSARDADGNIIINQDLINSTKSENLGNTTAFSLQVPLLIGTSCLKNKLLLRTGPVFSYLLRSTEVRQKYDIRTGVMEYKDTSNDSFNEFQAGVALQSTYFLTRKIGVDLGAQKFLTQIYKGQEQIGGKARYNFLSLGIRYNLL